jgi:DNA topoisomerase IB
VHPGVVESYLQGRLVEEFRPRRSRAAGELRPEEVAVLAFLKRLARAEKRSA